VDGGVTKRRRRRRRAVKILMAIRRWYLQLKCALGIDKVKCDRCHSEVTPSELSEYVYQCDECDEDLYSFETYTEVKK
jgi:hypothetical protein